MDLCSNSRFWRLLEHKYFLISTPVKNNLIWYFLENLIRSHLWHLLDYKTATPPVNTRFVTVLLLYWYVLYFCFCAFFRFCFFYDVPHGWFWNKFIIRPKAENINRLHLEMKKLSRRSVCRKRIWNKSRRKIPGNFPWKSVCLKKNLFKRRRNK